MKLTCEVSFGTGAINLYISKLSLAFSVEFLSAFSSADGIAHGHDSPI